MQVLNHSTVNRTKKPIQIYFEQEAIAAMNQAASKQKLPVATFLRNIVLKELKLDAQNSPAKILKHKFKTFDLGGSLSNKEIDSIIYDL